MSEKPQETRADAQEDLLEQIFAQGLETTAPAQTASAGEAPAGKTPPAPAREATPPAGRKNRCSAVYLYLLVLFGAAFLMLLLAYFIQRRSNEDTISDLRSSMNLSRQELLDQINALEEKNAALNEVIDRLNGEFAQLQEQYEEKEREAADLRDNYYFAKTELNSWASFWDLEQFYRAENLKGCAAVLLKQALSQHAYNGPSLYAYQTPDGMDRRYEEIVRAVVGAGILDWDYEQHLADYMELLNG